MYRVTTSQIPIFAITDGRNEDIYVNEANAVSKRLFPAHVREMHRNRDEGFEREFAVSLTIHHPQYPCK